MRCWMTGAPDSGDGGGQIPVCLTAGNPYKRIGPATFVFHSPAVPPNSR